MNRDDLPHLLTPEVIRQSHWEDPHETRVANWIRPWDFAEPMDVGLLMVPIARGAIKHVATHLGPNAFRMAWPFFTTYTIDYGVDMSRLRVRDLGDVDIPLLDIQKAHRNIEATVFRLLTLNREFFPITIGGEHSLVYPLLKAFKAARGYNRLGLIQFDAHMDLQTGEHGAHNGTPLRRIIEDGIAAGDKVVQIGVAGFVQASWHHRWGRQQGVTVFTARDVAVRGIAPILSEAVSIAGQDSDAVYVTFDIDCLDQAYAPGTGASLPGGLTPWQAYDGLFELGLHPRVMGLDIVEVDPSRDVFDITVRLASKLMLSFLAGYSLRLGGTREQDGVTRE